MRFLTLIEVLELHRRVIGQSGGTLGIRDMGLLESAIARLRRKSIARSRSQKVIRDRIEPGVNGAGDESDLNE